MHDDDTVGVDRVLAQIGVDYLQPYQRTLLEQFISDPTWGMAPFNDPPEERFRLQNF